MRTLVSRIVALLLLHSCVAPLTGDEPLPRWIWFGKERASNQAVCFQRQFTLDKPLRRAQLVIAADYCHGSIFLNGKLVATQEPYGPIARLDAAEFLRHGDNTLGICCLSVPGPAAVMARLELEYAGGERLSIATGKDWQVAVLDGGLKPKWPPPDVVWREATELGTVATHRWGLDADTIGISPVDDYTQWMRAVAGTGGTDPKTFQVADGFTVELLRSAAKDEGSWISLTSDARGRWIIGMEKQGLLRLTLPERSGEAKVERINDTLHECRGLVFADDALYAMANNDHALFRLRDRDGDDQFEHVEKLTTFAGGVGHGRNQLTLGPDGEVWGIFGDSVTEPDSAKKLPPPLARPTSAEATPNGFVARFNADASEIKVIARGLRNPFGIAFNEHGDMFTYDADAEYDMGASWYRPTRVLHLIPGGDYGWRSVTGRWPPYFPDRADMPQPTLDIGKGSPTAVEFGAKSHFPPRYRSALFVLDWAYGRILAVHLTPRGSSYQAAAETFLRGQPLNVTDIEFGIDGAMYFVTGGRGTQSALYRVKFTGAAPEVSQPTVQEKASEAMAVTARATRRQLEALLEQPDASTLETIWPQLGSSDPWIRHAARAALETLPLETWREQALAELDLDKALAARIALVRRGGEPRWLSGRFAAASARQKQELLYLAERMLAQSSSNDAAQAVLTELRICYPDTEASVNQAVSLLLASQPDETFVRKTLALMSRATSQAERLHYAFVLRHVTIGWTSADRQTYFDYLRQMDDYVVGEGLPTSRKLIRQEAVASLPPQERPGYEKLLAPAASSFTGELPPARTEVFRKWTVEELATTWSQAKGNRDPARGKSLFAEARCIVCHRAGGPGGVSGPDLTSVARRFSPRDILTSMIEPSKVIDEKYAAQTLELADGRILTGRIAPGDYRSPEVEVVANLLEPEKAVKLAKADVVRRDLSPLSPMPEGLLDSLRQDEIFDLLAFLLAAEQPDR